MSYRVSVIEIREMLRLWLQGLGLREVARLSGSDRKTVRRYVDRARACGLDRDGDAGQLTDELMAAVIAGVRPSRRNGKSQAWETIAGQHGQIQAWLTQGLTLTKVHTLLGRRGVVVSYRTLHRYATTELGFGQRQATVPVADCEPGHPQPARQASGRALCVTPSWRRDAGTPIPPTCPPRCRSMRCAT
jgi:hypothetical protein